MPAMTPTTINPRQTIIATGGFRNAPLMPFGPCSCCSSVSAGLPSVLLLSGLAFGFAWGFSDLTPLSSRKSASDPPAGPFSEERRTRKASPDAGVDGSTSVGSAKLMPPRPILLSGLPAVALPKRRRQTSAHLVPLGATVCRDRRLCRSQAETFQSFLPKDAFFSRPCSLGSTDICFSEQSV